MFNISGSEMVFLVLIALVVLGPDKLPEAMRKAGKAYADFKKMTSGFQNEMRSVLDEPMRELRETAELAKKAASWDTDMFGTKSTETKPVSATMADQTPADPVAPVAVDVVPPTGQNGAVHATTRRLYAQAAADLTASTQARTAQPAAVVASGEISVFSPAAAPDPAPDWGPAPDIEAVAAPTPLSPRFASAAPQVQPPVAVEDSGTPAGTPHADTDAVVVE